MQLYTTLLSLLFLGCLVATVTYFFRAALFPFIHRIFPYSAVPSSFERDLEDGFTSAAFDLSLNVNSGDTRAGLDDNGRREITGLMHKHRLNFDEARVLYFRQLLKKSDIGPDGVPRDPKFISFS